MSYSFKDKVALVTGSSKGIGRAILYELAKTGCIVILHYHKNSSEAKKTFKEIKKDGYKIDIYSGDLTKESKVKNLFRNIQKKYKRLDILINNVGNDLKKDLNKLKTNEWHEIINSN